MFCEVFVAVFHCFGRPLFRCGRVSPRDLLRWSLCSYVRVSELPKDQVLAPVAPCQLKTVSLGETKVCSQPCSL